MAAGNDHKIIFYDSQGLVVRDFDYTYDDQEREYTAAEFSPSGQSLVVGSFNKYLETFGAQIAGSAPFSIPQGDNSGRRKKWH